MMSGTVKTVTKGDGSVETTHEFPLGLALNLLRLHRDVAKGIDGEEAQGAPAEADEARRVEVIERLMRKMGKLRERMDREEAAAAAAAEQGGGAGEGAAEQGRDEILGADHCPSACRSAGEGAEPGQ
jgi:hypothetical protein